MVHATHSNKKTVPKYQQIPALMGRGKRIGDMDQCCRLCSKSDKTYFPSQKAILNWLPKLVRMWFTVCSSSTLVRRVSAIQRCFISHHNFSMRLSSGL